MITNKSLIACPTPTRGGHYYGVAALGMVLNWDDLNRNRSSVLDRLKKIPVTTLLIFGHNFEVVLTRG